MKKVKTKLSKKGFVFPFLGILFLSLAFPAEMMSGQDKGEDERILDVLKEAQGLYLRAEYAPALEKFKQAIGEIKKSGKEKLYEGKVINAYLAMGVCHLGLNDMESAKKAFFEVVKIRPDLELDPVFYSPKVVSAFEEARADFRRIAEEERLKREEEERKKAEELRKEEEKRKAEEAKVIAEKAKEKEKPAPTAVVSKVKKESGEKKIKKRKFPWLLVVAGLAAVGGIIALLTAKKKKDDNATQPKFTFQFVTKWGGFGSGDGQFNHPWCIALDSTGYFYITEIDNYRVQKFTTNGNFVGKWGSYGYDNGQFADARGIAADQFNNIYVVNAEGGNRIQKFNSSGQFLLKWNASGWSTGIAVYQNYVYVCEYLESRVSKFDLDGNFIKSWGEKGTSQGFFYSPEGVAVDRQGNVYVADSGNNRVQMFDSNGGFLREFKHIPSKPKHVVVDDNGDVYVADGYNNRICKFSSDGTYVGAGGSFGTSDGQFNYPSGLAIDREGYLLVVDYNNHRVQKFKIR